MTSPSPVLESTTQIVTRIPKSLVTNAVKAGKGIDPEMNRSGVIRYALAKLAGMSDADALNYSRALPKTKNGLRHISD